MDDGSKGTPRITVGVDLGDRYSYLCLIDTESGEVIEEGRLRTTPEALKRRFCSEQRPLRIAIEAGTHSPWVSRVLEECGHEVLVANPRKLRLIYANKRKTDEIDAENLARLARLDPKLKLLVGSANYILGPFGSDSDLRRHGEKIASRGGKNAKKRAAVAVARKLSVLLHRLWSTGEHYDPLYNTHRRAEQEQEEAAA
jgi:hypothetical protein